MEMLQKDIPVILCIPQMVLPKEKRTALLLYQRAGLFLFSKISVRYGTLCCGDRVDY